MLDIRQRTGYLLLAVMLGHIILISAQVNSRSGVKVLEAVTFGVFSEIQRAASSVIGGVRSVWTGYIALRGAKEENDALRAKLAHLQVTLQSERAVASRSERLLALLELRDRSKLETLAAEVVAGDATPWFRTVTIDRGTADGLRRDMAVIGATGVVGRIVGEPGARAAKVQLLVDRNAAAGALIERSRAAGVVVGAEGDPPLRMDYVSNLADVKEGDLVVTSGTDGIYPKGFVIGRVESVKRGVGLYKAIAVRPVVDYTGLEEVLVVLSPTPVSPEAEGGE